VCVCVCMDRGEEEIRKSLLVVLFSCFLLCVAFLLRRPSDSCLGYSASLCWLRFPLLWTKEDYPPLGGGGGGGGGEWVYAMSKELSLWLCGGGGKTFPNLVGNDNFIGEGRRTAYIMS
jgi:hypothetical protein